MEQWKVEVVERMSGQESADKAALVGWKSDIFIPLKSGVAFGRPVFLECL